MSDISLSFHFLSHRRDLSRSLAVCVILISPWLGSQFPRTGPRTQIFPYTSKAPTTSSHRKRRLTTLHEKGHARERQTPDISQNIVLPATRIRETHQSTVYQYRLRRQHTAQSHPEFHLTGSIWLCLLSLWRRPVAGPGRRLQAARFRSTLRGDQIYVFAVMLSRLFLRQIPT